ncbi:MAG: serine/threonine-protein kinase, partial [Myxococcaceae bacterium]
MPGGDRCPVCATPAPAGATHCARDGAALRKSEASAPGAIERTVIHRPESMPARPREGAAAAPASRPSVVSYLDLSHQAGPAADAESRTVIRRVAQGEALEGQTPKELLPVVDELGSGDTVVRDPLVGAMLDQYRVTGRIGEGGMGVVYRAVQPLIGKEVAVKVLKPHVAEDPDAVKRLLEEARAVNAIRHRGIIDIFGFGQLDSGQQYVVMELLQGQPLDEFILERGRLPPAEVALILDEVLSALGAAHDSGVIHRDLKPNNIFLVSVPGAPRFAKLLDFGLVKRSGAAGDAAKTRINTTVGTPEYIAPE